MKTIYEFEESENPVIDVCNYVFREIEKVLDNNDQGQVIQDIRDKILDLKGIMVSESYVPRKIAELLRKAGFSQGSSYIYDEDGDLIPAANGLAYNSELPGNRVEAPTLQKAHWWVRDHNIHFDVVSVKSGTSVLYEVSIKDANTPEGLFPVLKKYSDLSSQEEAIILGLLWSLKYILK